MPRKPDNRVTMNVRIDPDLKDELDTAADERCVSRNLIVEQAVRRFLARLEPLEPPPAPETRINVPGPPWSVQTPQALPHRPIVPVLEATESGVYLPTDNGDGTVTMDLVSTEPDDTLPTVHTTHTLRMEAIAADLPGINVRIGPRTCRQEDCEEEATAGPWCPEHLRALLEHPDPENGR